MLSYRRAFAGRPLVVAWPANEFCDGAFLDFFQPLPGVRWAFEPDEMPAGMEVTQERMVFEAHADIKGTAAETAMYADLVPLKGVAAEVERRKPAAPYVAAHVRRTDHWTAGITEERATPDASFERFFARHAARDRRLFLATDNADTQRHLARRLAPRQLAFHPISTRADLRQTETRDAVVDLYVCAGAHAFAGSFGSSFSDTIAHLRAVRGVAHPDEDEHALMGTEALSGRALRPDAADGEALLSAALDVL